MVYMLFVQESGDDNVSTTKLSMNDFCIIKREIAEKCDGYSISEKEYKKLIRGQNIDVKASGRIFEIALS